MGFLWKAPAIVESAIIYLRCPHFLDPARAVSAWPTFDDYNSDLVLKIAHWSVLLATLGIVYFTKPYFAPDWADNKRERKTENLFE